MSRRLIPTSPARGVWNCAVVAAACAGLGLASASDAQIGPPVPAISPDLPADVVIPTGFSGLPIDFFDDYSWRAFIAMVWPADPHHRGAPDLSAPLDGAGTRVFETFKSNWETFQPGGVEPSAWNTSGGVTPCSNVPADDPTPIIVGFSKFEEIGQATQGKQLAAPLVAQNRTYVRYQTGYNEPEYNLILSRKLYIRDNIKKTASPVGALVVKSSWIEMDGIEHPETFYTRMAWVKPDPASGQCVKRLLGLVGLHIVQKTPTRPQWIWSSFEHVDNVPPSMAGPAATFNAGDGTPMPGVNPNKFPPDAPPQPFNVLRLTPIHDKTRDTNTRWRAMLGAKGSVWANYQLVMTQWPIPVSKPNVPGDPANTFPGLGATSAFANTTMETYEQLDIDSGCMSCHDSVRVTTDFVWSIQNHAFKPPKPPPSPLGKALLLFTPSPQDASDRALLRRLLEARKANDKAARTRSDISAADK